MKIPISLVVVAGLLVAAPAWPQTAQTATDQQIQLVVERAKQRLAQAAQPAPATSQPPAAPGGTTEADRPVVALTLDEAVKNALDRNLNIAVQRLTPQTYDFQLSGLRAAYRPSVNSSLSTRSATTPSSSQLSGGQAVNSGNQAFSAGLRQNMPWGGGSFTLDWTNSRQTTTNSFSTFNPAFNTDLVAQYTQPLLRGFSIDSTRQQLSVTNLNREISDIQLKSTVTNTLSDVRNAYWDLVYAVQAVEVARESVTLANRLVEDNKTRVQVGTMAPLDVVQAQSQAATAQQALVLAEGTRRTAELALKKLMVNGTNDPIWDATLNPTDRPEFQPQPIDLDAAVQKALAQRTDLQIAQRELQSNTITVKFLHNQVLPQADFVASYGTQGLGGTRFVRSGGLGSSDIASVVPGGYYDALSALGGQNFPTWNFSLNFSYPLGTSTADAAVARAQLQVNQTQAQMKQLQLQVATDVTNAAITVQSSVEAVQAARAARELAQKELEAEQSKFEVGMSTNYFVVQAQRDLATAENSELQATLNYRKALVELDRVEQTTLQNTGVTIVSSGGLNNSAVGSGRPTVVAGGGGGN